MEVETLWFDFHVLVFDVIFRNIHQYEKLRILRAHSQLVVNLLWHLSLHLPELVFNYFESSWVIHKSLMCNYLFH